VFGRVELRAPRFGVAGRERPAEVGLDGEE
jgi:hypothetical protein